MRGAEFPYGWASRSCSGDEGGAGGSCLPVREARARCSLIPREWAGAKFSGRRPGRPGLFKVFTVAPRDNPDYLTARWSSGPAS